MFGNKAIEKLALVQLKKVFKENGLQAIVVVPDQDGELFVSMFKNKILIKEIKEDGTAEITSQPGHRIE